jgi:hypothetical protein
VAVVAYYYYYNVCIVWFLVILVDVVVVVLAVIKCSLSYNTKIGPLFSWPAIADTSDLLKTIRNAANFIILAIALSLM